MLTKVTDFKILDGYRISVQFNNGAFGTYDLSLIELGRGPASQPLLDAAYFRRAFLEFGALTWPNGFDIDPEWLRREMDTVGELHYPKAAE